MTVFWTMFWLGCIGMPLIILIAGSLESGGYEKDTSHIWVYKRSGVKSHDASVREVWEHNHPGRKWADHQASQSIGCGIVLGIALIIFLAWLADQIFIIPEGRVGLRLFWVIGGPILGGLSAGGIYALQSKLSDYKSGFLLVLHIIALAVMGLGVIGALVLTFLKIPLPISNHWLWAPLGAMCLFLILDAIGKKEKKVKAGKGGAKFEDWVMKVLGMVGNWNLDQSRGVIEGAMAMATIELGQGKYDWNIRDDEFFKMTEGILVDLIQGKAMSIPTKEIYQAREGIIQAVQAFYFYMVDNFREYDIHPAIKRAVSKNK
jgi:hypothetical protein